MKALKAFVAALILPSPILSQSQPSVLSACGQPPEGVAVNLDHSQHSMMLPEPGKALIYFIEDVGPAMKPMFSTIDIGIDGRWVGADENNSYFAVEVDPGWHDLCAEVQSPLITGNWESVHLVAEPGKVYYFRTRIFFTESAADFSILVPIDGVEAARLIASYPQATAQAGIRPVLLTVRRRCASGRGKSWAGPQLALNSKQETVAEQGKVGSSRHGENPASGADHRQGKLPEEHRDASNHPTGGNTGGNATRRAQ